MGYATSDYAPNNNLPDWVSEDIRLYLEHTEGGRTIRSLARDSGCHASTILRRVRKTESRRDDPLVDNVLIHLGRLRQIQGKPTDATNKVIPYMADIPPDETTLKRDATRILRALIQKGAVLAVVPDVETAIVVVESKDGRPRQTATVPRRVAEAMALQKWIECANTGKVARYYITQSGRIALRGFLAEQESQQAGFSEAPAGFQDAKAQGSGRKSGLQCIPGGKQPRKKRAPGAESPLQVLARRREKSGKPYLSPDLVFVGERLRMDFELAMLENPIGPGWDAIMNAPSGRAGSTGQGPDMRQAEARKRLENALKYLGPELGDMALIACCQQLGMEHAEKQLTMPARSGKYVLRIALNMLARHYASLTDDSHDLIY